MISVHSSIFVFLISRVELSLNSSLKHKFLLECAGTLPGAHYCQRMNDCNVSDLKKITHKMPLSKDVFYFVQ